MYSESESTYEMSTVIVPNRLRTQGCAFSITRVAVLKWRHETGVFGWHDPERSTHFTRLCYPCPFRELIVLTGSPQMLV